MSSGSFKNVINKMCLQIFYSIYMYKQDLLLNNLRWGRLRGEMGKAMDCEIVVSKFVLQLCYYVNFRANTLRKGMNPLILPAIG